MNAIMIYLSILLKVFAGGLWFISLMLTFISGLMFLGDNGGADDTFYISMGAALIGIIFYLVSSELYKRTV